MITEIRSNLKNFVIKFLLLILALSFVLWGVGDIFRKKQTALMSVDNSHYSAAEIAPLIKQQVALIERQLNYKVTPDDLKNPQFQQIILRQVVNDLVIRKYADENNILISDDTLKYQIASIPMFLQDGKFNKDLFDEFLKQGNMTEIMFLDNLRNETRVSAVMTMFASFNLAPTKLRDAITNAFSQERAVTMYKLNDKDMVLDSKPTEDDLKRVYEERKESFVVPERRKMEYAYITMSDVKNVPTITEEMVKAEYESRKKLFISPERRDVLQMVFTDKAKADAAHLLLDAGTDFNKVAEQSGIDKKSMFMGEVTKNGFSPEIAKAIFDLELGKYSAVTQSPIGFHIFYVQKILPSEMMSFEAVRKDLEASLKNEKSFEAYNELITSISADSSNHMAFDEIVSKYALKKHSTEVPGDFKADSNIEAAIKTIASAAFAQADTLATTVSNVDRDKYFIVRTSEISEKSEQAFDAVKGDLLKIWMKGEAMKKANQVATNFLKELADGADEKALIAKYKLAGSKVIVSRAKQEKFNPDLLEDIMVSPVGKYTNIYPSQAGVEFAKVESVSQAQNVVNPEVVQQGVSNDIQNELYMAMIEDLRKRYKVSVDEKVFEQMMY